jgi:hypothetical protein
MATSISGDAPIERGHRGDDEGGAGGHDPRRQVDAACQHGQHLAGGEHGERDGELDRVAGQKGEMMPGRIISSTPISSQQEDDQRDDRVVLQEPAEADEGAVSVSAWAGA